MKTLILNLTLATAAVTGLTAAPDAHAMHDYLLELDGVKGESSVRASSSEFRWTQAMTTLDFDPFHPAFAGGVSVAVGDLTGDGVWEQFTMLARERGTGTVIFEYGVPVARVAVIPTPPGMPDKWVQIDPGAGPFIRYRPPLPGGGRGDPIVGGWNTAGQFVGDAGVFGAFEELHATRWADGTLVISTVPEPSGWALALLGTAVVLRRLRRDPRSAE